MPPFPRPFPLPPEPTLPPFDGGPLVITAGGARVPQDGVTPWDMVLRVSGIVSEMEISRVRLKRNEAKKMVEKLVQNWLFSMIWRYFVELNVDGWEREFILPCKKI